MNFNLTILLIYIYLLNDADSLVVRLCQRLTGIRYDGFGTRDLSPGGGTADAAVIVGLTGEGLP
jgi:hypothetical protein